jgi:hypothetical protein
MNIAINYIPTSYTITVRKRCLIDEFDKMLREVLR